MLRAFVVACVLVGLVTGHSWVECNDYPHEVLGQDYDAAKCAGYPRYGGSVDFGINTGGRKRNRNGKETDINICKTEFKGFDAHYDEDFPMAQYKVGSTIRLLWPAKNHVVSADDDTCDTNGRRDDGLELYTYLNDERPIAEDATSLTDPTSVSEMQLLKDWHAEAEARGIVFPDNEGVNGVAFQNCPKFCADTDLAVCYGDWNLTTDMFESTFGGVEGIYTFIWLWRFGDFLFTTCWEAELISDGDIVVIESDGGEDADGNEIEEIIEPESFIMTIPVCYLNGNGYEQASLENAFDQISDKLDGLNSYGEVTFTIGNISENLIQWNGTVESSIIDEDTQTLIYALIDNATVCNIIQSEFANVGTCSICGGASVVGAQLDSSSGGGDSSSGGGGSNEDDDGAVVAVVVVIVLLIVFGLAGFGLYKYRKNQKQGSMSTNIVTTTANAPQTNIGPMGARPIGPPPVPPSAVVASTSPTVGTGGETYGRPNAPPRPRPQVPVPPPRY